MVFKKIEEKTITVIFDLYLLRYLSNIEKSIKNYVLREVDLLFLKK